jgi:CHAD domain-containing protein
MAKAFPLFAIEPHGKLSANAPLMLHTRLAEMYRFADCVDDVNRVDELHNMRIAAKRLRYTMEIFASCFPGDEFASLYESVKSIQEQIGDIHDCDVRIPLIQAFVDGAADERPEIRIGLQTAIQSERAKRNKLYDKFRTYWGKLQEKTFHHRFLELLVRKEDADSAPR